MNMFQKKQEDALELTDILDHYRQMMPISKLVKELKRPSQENKFEYNSIEYQDCFVKKVLQDPVVIKYPPCQKYTFNFVSTYLNEIEKNEDTKEISDALCEYLHQLLIQQKKRSTSDISSFNDNDYHYISYRITDAKQKAIDNNKEEKYDSSVIATFRIARITNEVGLRLWESAFYLAEFCILNSNIFKEKSVLELGAGVGLTGIVVAKCCRAKHIIMTDYTPVVLYNLSHNISINTSNNLSSSSYTIITCQKLDWTNVPTEPCHSNVLLCADCVYDHELFPDLVRVLKWFFASSSISSSSIEKVAFFAITLRNKNTFYSFKNELENAGDMKWRDLKTVNDVNIILPSKNMTCFYYENRESIILWELKSSNIS